MGTHLSSTARRSACALALVVGVAAAIVLPAAAASHGKPAAHHRAHVSTGKHVAGGGAVLGTAVKYVRTNDGRVHKVR
jgi:hypothetical protein